MTKEKALETIQKLKLCDREREKCPRECCVCPFNTSFPEREDALAWAESALGNLIYILNQSERGQGKRAVDEVVVINRATEMAYEIIMIANRKLTDI